MYRYVKALAAFLGGLSPVAAAGVITLLGIHLDPADIARWIAVASPVIGTLATYLAPANAAKAAPVAAPAPVNELPAPVEDSPAPTASAIPDAFAPETLGADAASVVNELARRLERP